MKKIFLIPLLTLLCSVMAWANVAQITVGETTTPYADLAALQEAIAALPTDGTVATIKLLDDIDGGELAANQSVLSLPENTKSILDLNGRTLSAQLKLTNYEQRLTIHVINNFGELTINDSQTNGTIKNSYLDANKNSSSHDCISVIRNNAGATLTLNKCIIYNGAMGIDNYGTMTINNDVRIEVAEGTKSTLVNSKYGYSNGGDAISARNGSHTTINGGFIKSHSFNAIEVNKSAIVAINGGEFYGVEGYGWLQPLMTYKSQLTISGGSFDMDPTEYVDQTHYADLVDSRYVIKDIPDGFASTVFTFAELQEKLNSATNEQPVFVTLGADINVAEVITLQHGSQLTIPAGRSLTVIDGGLFVNDGKTVNSGTIATIDNGFFSKPASVIGSGAFSISNLSLSVNGDEVTYVISNGMQLQYLAYLASLSEYADKTWNISLSTDINLPTEANFERIGTIIGVFDGNNYAINNLTIISESVSAALIQTFGGTFQNVTLNNININVKSTSAALFNGMKPNSLVKNVKLNGSVTVTGGSASGFVGGMYNSGMTADDHLWFVNCENNVNLTAGGSWAGGYCGTLSGVKGTIGFYNCSNKGNLSCGTYAGALVGYTNATIDIIAFTNTGTITAGNNTSPWKPTGVNNYLGWNGKTPAITYLDATTWTAVYDEAQGKYVAKEAGIIDNTAATTIEWNKTTTWTDEDEDYMVPSEADVVTVNNAAGGVVVNNGVEAEAKQVIVAADKTLTVQDGGTLTIGEGGLQIAAGATVTVEEGATLVVGKDGINIADGGHLVVEATEEGGTGVVLVDPAADEADARPIATVELIPDAYKVSEDFYKHRYVGIPLYFEGAEEFTSANWERAAIQGGESVVSHAKIWNNGWQDVASISEFVPFKGYALTNESTHGVKYTFKGKLVGNGDGQMNFVPGFNLFANSYTAPINIQTLLNGLTDDVKATIYMFDNDRLRSVSKADFAGFRTPKFTVIPSLQAFFVLMDDGTSASESINYAEAVFNNSLGNRGLYAPARQETPDFNRVRINIAAENGTNDEVYLIEAADYTNDFENGYDEAKFMNNGLNIYATTAYGRQATKISNDLNGTFIGVQGNGTYTLSFDELVGEEYQIRDLQNGVVIAMTEDNTYTFTANGAEEARFVVEKIRKIATGMDNIEEANLFVSNNTLYVGANNADIQIFAANGQLVIAEKAQATVDLSGLAAGVYTVRVANQTLKFVK